MARVALTVQCKVLRQQMFVQAAVEAQTAFLEAKAALSAQMAAISPDMHLQSSSTTNNIDSSADSTRLEPAHDLTAPKAQTEPPKDEELSAVRVNADSHASSASLLVAQTSPGVSHASADSADSPGSVENQPQHANVAMRQDRLGRQGSFKGILGSTLGSLSFNKRSAAASTKSGQIAARRSTSESGAVLGERVTGNSNSILPGARRSTDALSLLDTAWFSHSGAFD